MKVIAFVPTHNSHGKRDVTGAFMPEATAFLKAAGNDVGSSVVKFDNAAPMKARRAQVVETLLSKPRAFDSVAFFCHGWADGMQAGFTREHVDALALALLEATGRGDLVVPLYCCSTGDDPYDAPKEAAGSGEDSFADRLRDALCKHKARDCRVMGHTTVAHTTKNPNALFFDGMGSEFGGAGGFAPVAPGSALWPRWRKALQSTDLRFRFPYLTVAAIHAELGAT